MGGGAKSFSCKTTNQVRLLVTVALLLGWGYDNIANVVCVWIYFSLGFSDLTLSYQNSATADMHIICTIFAQDMHNICTIFSQ